METLCNLLFEHLIPALPGYDFDEDSDFTSVEQIAKELVEWLEQHDINHLYAIYGCSLGGSIAAGSSQDSLLVCRK